MAEREAVEPWPDLRGWPPPGSKEGGPKDEESGKHTGQEGSKDQGKEEAKRAEAVSRTGKPPPTRTSAFQKKPRSC